MRWAVVAALAVLLALPAVLSSYAVTIFILIFFYGFLGQAWNIVGGYAGQLSVELFAPRFQQADPFPLAQEIWRKTEAVMRQARVL